MRRMDDKGQGYTTAIIAATVAVIVLMAGWNIVNDVISPVIERQNYTENTSFVLNNTTGNPSHTSLTAIVDYNCTNGTEQILNGSANILTADTDYVFLVSNYSIIGSLGMISETVYFTGCEYYDEAYISDDPSMRTVLTQIPVLLAVLGLIIVAALLMIRRR